MKNIILIALVFNVASCVNSNIEVPLFSRWFNPVDNKTLDFTRGERGYFALSSDRRGDTCSRNYKFTGNQTFGIYIDTCKESMGAYYKQDLILTLIGIKPWETTKFNYFGDPEIDLVLSVLETR